MCRLTTLETAKECLQLGARPRTTRWLTGLSNKAVLRLTAEANLEIPRGRPPYSEEFFHGAAPSVKAEICTFAGNYEFLVEQQVLPALALIGAYRHYCAGCLKPTFTFDQAFFVVSCLSGLWAAPRRSLFLRPCGGCASPHLVSNPDVPTAWCPFCEPHATKTLALPFLEPVVADRRNLSMQSGVASVLEQRIQAIRMQDELERLGASQRHVQILTGALADSDGACCDARTGLGKELPLERWSLQVKTLDRAVFAALACTYRRVSDGGCAVGQAFVAAFRHISSLPGPTPTRLRFDKAFNVIAALDGLWGAQRRLELVECPSCQSRHLVSLLEPEPAHCPFCQVARRPEVFGLKRR
ncbi:FlhC family transcriptional regulator [Azohydromonas lata]|uniref:FlhC family transcriptional regulator n=1 Tax=Azohydromonas lata TaxID=45677 RepID=A0ABU5I7J9_9BURK|nr:FlhC family transcriptional regulator [Azohydromonas lata]MDZ5455067.1 FlhC family transcriptional regulator [Azohydromonas lata]